MSASSKTSVTLALAAAIGTSATAYANENPFQANELSQGYMVASSDTTSADKARDGKCGEGKCGAAKNATGDKAKDGKCGANKTDSKGSKARDGKCGEGKCGANK